MSLIVSNTGLDFGDGLIFQKGLGGDAGLIIDQEGVQFGGTGSLRANAIVINAASARLNGTGSLNALGATTH